MKRLFKIQLALITVFAAVAVSGCGSNTGSEYEYDRNANFYVERTEPTANARNVSLNQPLRVYFTLPVDRESIMNQSVFYVSDITGGGSDSRTMNTVSGMTGLINGGLAVEFIPNLVGNQWEPNKIYQLTVTKDARSQTGKQLSQGFSLRFTTGSTNLGGQISLPGRPVVESLEVRFGPYATPEGDCLAFKIRFNEDMAVPPLALARLEYDIFNLGLDVVNGYIQMYVFGDYSNFREFYIAFPDYGCNSIYFGVGQNIIIKAYDGFDLDGEYMSTYEDEFHAGSDYLWIE
jgi:hypothetical protein